MLRLSLFSLCAMMMLDAGLARANDSDKKQSMQHLQATITKVDKDKNTLAVKTIDKNGKEEDKTLQLSKDAKYLDSAGKDAKLDSFKVGDDVWITQKEDKVTELRKHAEAKIVKVDAKAGTIRVKMTDRDGKDVERTFRLVEDSEYFDSTGRVAVLDVFQSGDDILLVEADGTIKGMKKTDTHAKTSSKDSNEKSNK
jgi:hypothetical protein